MRQESMKTGLIFLAAAIAEIGGCCCLLLFAYLLTLIDTSVAGRAYAAYGGIYILVAVFWMWLAEGARPDPWDFLGVGLCLLGTVVILLAPHAR